MFLLLLFACRLRANFVATPATELGELEHGCTEAVSFRQRAKLIPNEQASSWITLRLPWATIHSRGPRTQLIEDALLLAWDLGLISASRGPRAQLIEDAFLLAWDLGLGLRELGSRGVAICAQPALELRHRRVLRHR